MPTLDELTNKTKKKFIKSDYRPWNYMEEFDKESNSNQLEVTKESIGNLGESNKKSIRNQPQIIEVEKKSKIVPNLIDSTNKVVPPKKQHEETSIEAIAIDIETTLDIIFRLTGHQKKIFMFIVDRCMSRGMLVTGVIKGETLAEITTTTMKMVKTSIQRLVGKSLIIREKGKTGRGGFYTFRIIEMVRNATIEYKRMVGIDNQLEIKKDSSRNQLEINRESNSDKKNILSDDWLKINIHPLEDIGFNHNHLIDVCETKLADPQMVQESILHFAYGLEYESAKYKQYDDVLNVLIGRLRKGKPWFEKNYRSPQEIAQIQLLESKKIESDRKEKIEEDAFKLALAEWQKGLAQSEIAKITIKEGIGDITPQTSKLALYFRKTIWPMQKKEYLIMEE